MANPAVHPQMKIRFFAPVAAHLGAAAFLVLCAVSASALEIPKLGPDS